MSSNLVMINAYRKDTVISTEENNFEETILINITDIKSITLETLQNLVGGQITIHYDKWLADRGYCLIANDTGLYDCPFNCSLNGYPLYGNLLIVKIDGQDMIPLNEEEKDFIMGTFKMRMVEGNLHLESRL